MTGARGGGDQPRLPRFKAYTNYDNYVGVGTVLAETQTAILPLVPCLDTLRWVFIAVALGGIAVTIDARLDDWRRGQR